MLKLPLLFMTSLLLLTSACAQQNDFDTLCSYFDSLESEEGLNKMTSLEKYTYINTLVSNIDSGSDARVSWETIINLPANKRYPMFIEVAEDSLKKAWRCESMKNQISLLPD